MASSHAEGFSRRSLHTIQKSAHKMSACFEWPPLYIRAFQAWAWTRPEAPKTLVLSQRPPLSKSLSTTSGRLVPLSGRGVPDGLADACKGKYTAVCFISSDPCPFQEAAARSLTPPQHLSRLAGNGPRGIVLRAFLAAPNRAPSANYDEFGLPTTFLACCASADERAVVQEMFVDALHDRNHVHRRWALAVLHDALCLVRRRGARMPSARRFAELGLPPREHAAARSRMFARLLPAPAARTTATTPTTSSRPPASLPAPLPLPSPPTPPTPWRNQLRAVSAAANSWLDRLDQLRPCAAQGRPAMSGREIDARVRRAIGFGAEDMLRLASCGSWKPNWVHTRVARVFLRFLLPLYGDAPSRQAHLLVRDRFWVVGTLLQSGARPCAVLKLMAHALRDNLAVRDVQNAVKTLTKGKKNRSVVWLNLSVMEYGEPQWPDCGAGKEVVPRLERPTLLFAPKNPSKPAPRDPNIAKLMRMARKKFCVRNVDDPNCAAQTPIVESKKF